MKKIPTLFEREYANHKVVGIKPIVTPGMEWVLDGEGEATVKIDGVCCAIINGVFYKRYDAKKGKTPPPNAIPCCDPDPVTGHWPHWVPVGPDNPADKWFVEAYKASPCAWGVDGTYEAVGPHFQGNPHKLPGDMILPHGLDKVLVVRTFDGIRDYLEHHNIEGLVFWKDGEPQCKIKRSDFGFPWPVKFEMDVSGKKILDVTCGGRSIWFDKHNPAAVYCDKRREEYHHLWKNAGNCTLSIDPDVLCDFTNLPFEDNSFPLVVFDPPHLTGAKETSWLVKKYGKLDSNWPQMLHDGFRECMRVLKPDGVLIFKWSEYDIPAAEVWKAIGQKPLFGHHSGKQSRTFWACFMKIAEKEEPDNAP